MDQIACWSGVCAPSQLAESPLWVLQGIVFGFHSQIFHTRYQHAPPHISFIWLMCLCHSWILLSQLALTSKSQSFEISQYSSCATFQPQNNPLYITTYCPEYCSQSEICRLGLAECPVVPLKVQISWPPSRKTEAKTSVSEESQDWYSS